MEVPFPTGFNPQFPVYQNQPADVPGFPPTSLSVAEELGHIICWLEEIELAGTELKLTVIEFELQDVVLQVPSALT